MLFGYGICVSLGNIREHFINDADMAFISCIPAGPHRIFRFLQALLQHPLNRDFAAICPMMESGWLSLSTSASLSSISALAMRSISRLYWASPTSDRQSTRSLNAAAVSIRLSTALQASGLGIRLRRPYHSRCIFPFLMVSAVAARLFRKPLRTNFSRHTLDGQNSLAAEIQGSQQYLGARTYHNRSPR